MENNLNELAAALCKAQSKMGGAKKDAANPFFKSKYADLESIWDAIRVPFSENGLSISQTTELSGDTLLLKTMLLHSSGQCIISNMPVLAKDNSPQAMGSAISYARRYSLAAIAGVYQTDDDAEAAQGRPQAPIRPPVKKPDFSRPTRPMADSGAEPPPFDRGDPFP